MTIVAGAKVDAGDLTRYFVKGTQGTAQSIPNNAFTAVQFNGTDDTDVLGTHDPVTNNSRFALGLKVGWWQVCAKFVTSGSGTAASQRRARLLLNGVATGVTGGYSAVPTYTVSAGTITQGGFWTVECNTLVETTAADDYIELHGFQDTGGAVNTTVSGDLRCQFIAVYLGP